MKKWYLFYAKNEQILDKLRSFNMRIDTESEKLQQVAAEIKEEPFEQKLQQPVAKIPFPIGFRIIRYPDIVSFMDIEAHFLFLF